MKTIRDANGNGRFWTSDSDAAATDEPTVGRAEEITSVGGAREFESLGNLLLYRGGGCQAPSITDHLISIMK
jgi:hypothetical protein